ncbi:MAG: metalloregulator ArsR/SmtB family transcription factor, partial [Dehalococcoidia bacterium]
MNSTLQDFKAELFRALANPVRIRILEALRAEGSLTVGEIQQCVGAEHSNVSQHLSIMRGRGLVEAQREGTSIRYSVTEPDLYRLLDVARAIFEHQLE